MPSTPRTSTRPPGPHQSLISRILHLESLLCNLPNSLPLNPVTSRYSFSISNDEIEEYGTLGAFSRCMEVCFETHKRRDGVIELTERGQRLERDLIAVMKHAVKVMSEADRTVFKDAWLEQLITTATRYGAKAKRKTSGKDVTEPPSKRVRRPTSTELPPTTPQPDTISISSDSESDDSMHPPVEDSPKSTSSPPQVTATSLSTVKTSGLRYGPAAGSSLAIKPTSHPHLGRMQQMTLTFMPLKEWSADELKAHHAQQGARDQEEQEKREEAREREDLEREKKKQHQRDLARVRQQNHRMKAAVAKAAAEGSDRNLRGDANKSLMQASQAINAAGMQLSTHDIAEVSRAGKEDWRQLRNGQLGGIRRDPLERTNYFHPFLWVHINKAVHAAGWNLAHATHILQCNHPQLFQRITRAMIWKWKEKNLNAWSEKTLANVKRRHALTGTGRVGILARHPKIVKEITQTLRDLRTSGIPINVLIARMLMLGIIKEREPDLLSAEFRCSERFVRCFLESVMSWTPRQATRAAAHIPADAQDVCERTFFRLVYAMKWENIPPCLLVNVDQMGVYILPHNSRTFHDKGAKQVDVVAKDEKRAYTLLVASTAAGDILPFQQVWGGKTKQSLPNASALGMADALERGFHFAFAASENNARSHFSTLKTMKEWVANILSPFRLQVLERDGLDDDQKMILYIDCYPVHASLAFRAFMFDDYPHIIIIYVPRNCTLVFQPADVGLQRPIKHTLKQALFELLAQTHQKQISVGIKPTDIQITTSLPELRNASVQGLVRAYDFLNGPDGRDLIKMAWRKSAAKQWCLSAECLTSKAAQVALNEYLDKDPTLRDEIRARLGTVEGIEHISDQVDSTNVDLNHFAEDDTDVPLSAVIADTVGLESQALSSSVNVLFTVSQVMHEDGEPGLVAAGPDENVWQFDDKGRRWSDTGNLPINDAEDQ